MDVHRMMDEMNDDDCVARVNLLRRTSHIVFLYFLTFSLSLFLTHHGQSCTSIALDVLFISKEDAFPSTNASFVSAPSEVLN